MSNLPGYYGYLLPLAMALFCALVGYLEDLVAERKVKESSSDSLAHSSGAGFEAPAYRNESLNQARLHLRGLKSAYRDPRLSRKQTWKQR